MKKIFCLALIVMMFALTGCGSDKKDDDTLKIVTSFYPIYLDVINITRGVDGVQVANRLPARLSTDARRYEDA